MPPTNLPARPVPRPQLEAPYRHPYRVAGRHAWDSLPAVRGQAKLSAALVAGGTAGALALSPVLWLTVAVGVMLALYVLLVWSAATIGDATRMVRHWRQKSELRSVRERRPHAHDADPDVVHDEYAVTAEDDGWLLTWRFRPLRHWERHDDETEVEVPGRPCYAARAVTEARFDARDAARAAEQLVAAQAHAETLEQQAIAEAHGGVADASQRAELAVEARTTAAALRRATGQDARRR